VIIAIVAISDWHETTQPQKQTFKMSIIGKPAPPISLPDTTGEIVNVEIGFGSPIALFFYPTAGLFHVLNWWILL
jgi:hypothetical protein